MPAAALVGTWGAMGRCLLFPPFPGLGSLGFSRVWQTAPTQPGSIPDELLAPFCTLSFEPSIGTERRPLLPQPMADASFLFPASLGAGVVLGGGSFAQALCRCWPHSVPARQHPLCHSVDRLWTIPSPLVWCLWLAITSLSPLSWVTWSPEGLNWYP